MRIAGEDAKFSTAYARRGVSAEFGMSWLLPRLVGMGHAMDMLLSARLVRSAEAERIGLVNRVVPDSELLSHAKAYAAEMAAQCSPQAMRLIKQQTLQDLGDNLPAAYARSEALLDQSFRSPDFREGVRSWQEQRPPSFPPLSGDQALIDLDS